MPKKKKAPKKAPKRRADISRPHNGGTWTEARKRQFITTALRRAQWPPKYKAVQKAYVQDGINPATGRKCKLHRCEMCGGLFPQTGVQADHIVPVVGPEGFVDWNTFIKRLYVEIDGYQILCKDKCHKRVTEIEAAERREHAAALSPQPSSIDQQLPNFV